MGEAYLFQLCSVTPSLASGSHFWNSEAFRTVVAYIRLGHQTCRLEVEVYALSY